MGKYPPAYSYLEQGRADLQAAKVADGCLKKCHQRYLLQQAYEKMIKAYMISIIKPNENEKVFHFLYDTLLRLHSPVTQSLDIEDVEKRAKAKYQNVWKDCIRVLMMVRQRSAGLLAQNARLIVLLNLDKEKQSINTNMPSYRYPFHRGRRVVIPAALTDSDWVAYHESSYDQLVKAVTELSKTVGNTVGLGGRTA